MNFNKIIMFLITASIAIAGASCSKDEADKIKPVINLISPADHEEFRPGETIKFEAEFTDNVELKQYKIDIHFDDGHDHKSVQNGGMEWEFEHVASLSGTSQRILLEILIPETAKHGEYHFMVFCTDAAGNESFVTIDIEIEDDHD